MGSQRQSGFFEAMQGNDALDFNDGLVCRRPNCNRAPGETGPKLCSIATTYEPVGRFASDASFIMAAMGNPINVKAVGATLRCETVLVSTPGAGCPMS